MCATARPISVPVKLDTSPRLPREMKKYEDPNFEFRVRDIAAADRARRGCRPDQTGVLVDAVREGGWAALGHLADGDMLLTIDGEPVPDVEAVQKKMARIAEAKPRNGRAQGPARHPDVLRRARTGWR